MLGMDESRAEIVPRIALHQIRDDPTNVTLSALVSIFSTPKNSDRIHLVFYTLISRFHNSAIIYPAHCRPSTNVHDSFQPCEISLMTPSSHLEPEYHTHTEHEIL
jgi:hypothetical protein